MSVRSTMLSSSAGDPKGSRHAAQLAPGRLVNRRYKVEKILGSGGMATVYLARHIEIGAPLAIKVLHPSLSAIPMATEHFLNEARGVSRIQHPHVVAVSDYGTLDDGVPYMVMEYLNGEDLETLLTREGPLPWPRVRVIARQLCGALGAAHLQGVVHRDVKPQNCLRQDHPQFGDFIKVLDFGIAQVGDDAARSGSAWSLTPKAIVGTPEYLAPEIGLGVEVDHRADIYSLGVTLFALVTGRLPFEAKDPWDQIEQHRTVPAPAPSSVVPPEVVLDPRVDAVILRALAKKPAERYASMAAFADAIESVQALPTTLDLAPVPVAAPPVQRKRVVLAVAAASLAAGASLTVALFTDPPAPPAVEQRSAEDRAATVSAPPPPPVPPPAVIAPPPRPIAPPPVAQELPPPPRDAAKKRRETQRAEKKPKKASGAAANVSSASAASDSPQDGRKKSYSGPIRNPYE